jgi:hypothetical protein
MDELSLHELFMIEMFQLSQERGREPDPDSWRWSPFDIRVFDIMLCVGYKVAEYNIWEAGQEPRQISIAEAGSGIGTKLYLAKHEYGLDEIGYENNDDYLVKARELDVHCEKWDLSDLGNQPVWSARDIVYTARPFKDEIFEAEWEQKVQDDMRPGAVLISAFTAVKPYSWPCYFRRPFCGVWAKPLIEQAGPVIAEYASAEAVTVR